jgi:hypothetical protein
MNITSVKHSDADGYTIVEDGISKSVPNNPDNSHYKAVMQWIEGGKEVEPQYTPEELESKEEAERQSLVDSVMMEIDLASIAPMRAYIASQPDAPQIIKDLQNQALKIAEDCK